MPGFLPITPRGREVAIVGQVLHALTGGFVEGARVQLTDGPPAFLARVAAQTVARGERWDSLPQRVDRATTAHDGLFVFFGLPEGPYALRVSLGEGGRRYGEIETQVEVRRGEDGALERVRVALDLPPTGVAGAVTSVDGDPVGMAQVRVEGSGERDYSADDGSYRLLGIEAGAPDAPEGARTLSVYIRGQLITQRQVRLARGVISQEDFRLETSST